MALTQVQTQMLGTGAVLQVVQGTLNTGYIGISSTTYVTATLAATITPKFSTSKILISFNSNMYFSVGSGPAYTTIYRNGSNIAPATGVAGIGTEFFNIANCWIPIGGQYLDSPSSTSALTYTLYTKTSTTGSTVLVGSDAGLVTAITLMEIAG